MQTSTFLGEPIEYWVELKKIYTRIQPVLNHPLIVEALKKEDLAQLKQEREELDYRIKVLEEDLKNG
jgi:hypothetical protein